MAQVIQNDFFKVYLKQTFLQLNNCFCTSNTYWSFHFLSILVYIFKHFRWMNFKI